MEKTGLFVPVVAVNARDERYRAVTVRCDGGGRAGGRVVTAVVTVRGQEGTNNVTQTFIICGVRNICLIVSAEYLYYSNLGA